MATAKRERQKALRAQKLEQQQKVTKRKQTGKKTLTAAVVVVVLVGVAVLIFHQKSPQVASIPSMTTGTTGAAKTDVPVSGFVSIQDPLAPGTWGVAPKVTVPSYSPPTTEEAQDLIVGKGAALQLGESFTAQYVLADFASHKVLQSSWTSGPFTANLQNGSLISGWVTGLQGMHVGGRRELIIPPSMGYGASGYGTIPGNDTLVFVVDLLKINK